MPSVTVAARQSPWSRDYDHSRPADSSAGRELFRGAGRERCSVTAAGPGPGLWNGFVRAEIVTSLVDAKTALDKEAIDDATKTAFCAARGKLSHLTGQIALQSVSPSSISSISSTAF